MSGNNTSNDDTEQNELWPDNPYSVPRIACGKCGTKHHIDAASVPEQGRCRECDGFLRRPTEAEKQQFADFFAWNARNMDTDT